MNRSLTQKENEVVAWMLEHGNERAKEKLTCLHQLRVIAQCQCGCASIDFAVGDDVPPTKAGMEVVSDYQWKAKNGGKNGVFVFLKDDLLAGLEVWSVDGADDAPQLPTIVQLEAGRRLT